MIEGFILPYSTSTVEGFVDAMGRSALDAIHNLRQTKGVTLIVIQWGKNHMNMVRHHDYPMYMELNSMIMQAML